MKVLIKSHKALSLSADAQAAFMFKEVCETERLKSDLADAIESLYVTM